MFGKAEMADKRVLWVSGKVEEERKGEKGVRGVDKGVEEAFWWELMTSASRMTH